MAGIYIHVPFCASRCIYCGFYSTTLLRWRQVYVDALCREMALRRDYLQGETVTTIYMGGGTPSMLSHAQLESVFACLARTFDLSEADFRRMEITLECNPDDVTRDWAREMSRLPVNRISMGAQTFDDVRLKWLHRRHRAAQTAQAVDVLRSAGYDNISIDLMYGFPEETIDEWRKDIEAALRLHVEHLSAYALSYEKGTPLYRMLRRGEIEEADEETSRAMYDLLTDMLPEAGYRHYEISNFALPGRESRHNASYWHDVSYLGVGAAAHSYDRRSRQWNVADVRRYVSSIRRGLVPAEREVIDDDIHYDETVMTRLRTREGIALDDLTPRRRDYLLRQSRPWIAEGMLAIDDGRLHLTRQGIFISDYIMSDLMA